MKSGLAAAAPFAYVPNEGSGTLSVIDTATDQVVAQIPAGKKPRTDKRYTVPFGLLKRALIGE